MGTITIGHRSFETPVLIPSVSSFETQLRQLDALRLQITLQEPISLVWPAPGSEDTELGVFMGPEVSHGETKVYAGVQA